MSIVRRLARPLLATGFIAGGVDAFRNSSTTARQLDPVLKAVESAAPQLRPVTANRAVVAQPGVTNLGITNAVQHAGFYYAPDPSSQIACTIGGNVAENAGGVHCLKYGLTVHNVLAVRGLTRRDHAAGERPHWREPRDRLQQFEDCARGGRGARRRTRGPATRRQLPVGRGVGGLAVAQW